MDTLRLEMLSKQCGVSLDEGVVLWIFDHVLVCTGWRSLLIRLTVATWIKERRVACCCCCCGQCIPFRSQETLVSPGVCIAVVAIPFRG
jgi:hypothetical protein